MAGTVQPPPQELVEALVHDVESAPERRLRGSELALRLRVRHPDFNPTQYGVLKLKQFIEKYAPRLRLAGWSGGDPLYGLAEEGHNAARPVRAVPTLQTESSSLWRVWASPRSAYAIAIDRQTLEVRRVVAGQTGESEVEIAPARPEVHLQIARKFLSSEVGALPEELRQTLEGILRENDPRWYERWATELGRVPELPRQWLIYRRRSLEREMETALAQAGLEQAGISKVMKSIVGLRPVDAVPAPERLVSTTTTETSDKQLVRIIQEVVARMNERELRDLKLPVGVVIDVVAGRKK
jgi:hypothetical protein